MAPNAVFVSYSFAEFVLRYNSIILCKL